MRLPADSSHKGILMDLISRYEGLLQSALVGEDCDQEMEKIESLFESEFEI